MIGESPMGQVSKATQISSGVSLAWFVVLSLGIVPALLHRFVGDPEFHGYDGVPWGKMLPLWGLSALVCALQARRKMRGEAETENEGGRS